MAGTAALAAGATPMLASAVEASPAKAQAESYVKEFHASLSDNQKKAICLPFGHRKQSQISANWQQYSDTKVDAVWSYGI